MNEIPSNLFQARVAPLSPDPQQLIEDFTARMKAIYEEQIQALEYASNEAYMRPEKYPQTRRTVKHLLKMFSSSFGWRFLSNSSHSQPSQPPAPDEDSALIIDAPYRVIGGKE